MEPSNSALRVTRLTELFFISGLYANILSELNFNLGLHGRVQTSGKISKQIWMTVLQRCYYYIYIILYYIIYII